MFAFNLLCGSSLCVSYQFYSITQDGCILGNKSRRSLKPSKETDGEEGEEELTEPKKKKRKVRENSILC